MRRRSIPVNRGSNSETHISGGGHYVTLIGYGVKGNRGEKGEAGESPETGDKTYNHVQFTASATWTINHALDKYPSIQVIDSDGDIVEGDTDYIDANTVVLTFAIAISGRAFLN